MRARLGLFTASGATLEPEEIPSTPSTQVPGLLTQPQGHILGK